MELSYFPKGSQEHLAYLTMLHNDNEIVHFEGELDNDTINKKAQGELTLSRFPLNIANAFLKKSGISTDGRAISPKFP